MISGGEVKVGEETTDGTRGQEKERERSKRVFFCSPAQRDLISLQQPWMQREDLLSDFLHQIHQSHQACVWRSTLFVWIHYKHLSEFFTSAGTWTGGVVDLLGPFHQRSGGRRDLRGFMNPFLFIAVVAPRARLTTLRLAGGHQDAPQLAQVLHENR